MKENNEKEFCGCRKKCNECQREQKIVSECANAVERKLELVEAKSEYSLIKQRGHTSRRLYLTILTTILGALIAIVNVFTACVCNTDINRCFLLVFNILNIVYIAVSCTMQIFALITNTQTDKDCRSSIDNQRQNDDSNIDFLIDDCRARIEKEQKKIRKETVLGLVCFAIIMMPNSILLGFVFNW